MSERVENEAQAAKAGACTGTSMRKVSFTFMAPEEIDCVLAPVITELNHRQEAEGLSDRVLLLQEFRNYLLRHRLHWQREIDASSPEISS